MSLVRSIVAAVAIIGTGAATAAPTHVYDFTYNGSAVSANQSAAGSALLIGESVGFTMRALGNDHMVVNAGNEVWIPISMVESGVRTGDLAWSFLLDGATVHSGSADNQNSAFVHIPQNLSALLGLVFDEVRWEYLLDASTSATNTLGSIFNGSQPFLSGNVTYVAVPDQSAVPEPASLLLIGAALAALGATRRTPR